MIWYGDASFEHMAKSGEDTEVDDIMSILSNAFSSFIGATAD